VLRSLLQLEPDVRRGQLHIRPILPGRLLPLRIENFPLAGARLNVTVESGGSIDIEGLPSGLRLNTVPHDSAPTGQLATARDGKRDP
jgi:hypothetical protein